MVKLFSYRFVLLCTCFAFCAHARLFAQFEKNYSPVNYSAGVKSSAKDQFFKNNSFTYGEMNQEEKNKFEKYLYSLHLAFCEVSNKGYFIQEKFFVDYFQNILDRILTANNISQKIEVVVTRSSLPNAYNIGDNKLYINIGLISQIQNESQIAFLLGHELSHQLLFHVQNSFIAAEK
jgi:Zn-dependent protease with chaperone function